MSVKVSLLNKLSGFASSKIGNVYQKLGADSDPLMTIVVLCLFNMSVRPLITLSDKNQPKERRYYAALRESITEIIALPTCVFFSRYLGGKLANHFSVTKTPEAIQSVKNVFSLAGLVAANFVIPILSTIALDPIMKDVKKRIIKNKNVEQNELNVVSETQPSISAINKSYYTVKPVKAKNIWSHYNFTTSNGLTIGK